MQDGKKYTVKDKATGKTVTFNWKQPIPPTDADFEEVFKSAGLRKDEGFFGKIFTPENIANTLSPVGMVNRMAQNRDAFLDGIKPALTPIKYADPRTVASTPPQQMIDETRTSLELGLPFLAQSLPTPLRVPATGLLQGTGTLVGEALQSAYNPSIGKSQVPLGKQFERAGESALYGAGAELIGTGLARGAQKGLAPFGNQVDQGSIDLSKKYGVKPLPSEVVDEMSTGANVARTMEEVAEKSIFSGAMIGRRRSENFAALQKYKTDVLDKIAPQTKPTELKEMVLSAIEDNQQTFNKVAGNLFRRVEQETAKLGGVPIVQTKLFAKRILESIPEQERVAAKQGGTAASALADQMERIAALPDQVKFSDAQFYRSQLLETVRGDKSPLGGRIKGTAKKLSSLLEEDMAATAKAGGSEAMKLYREASDFWKQGKELFNESVVADLAKKDPEELARFVFSPRSGESIRAVEKAVDPNSFKSLQMQAEELGARYDGFQKGVGHQFTMVDETGNVGTTFYAKQGESLIDAVNRKRIQFGLEAVKKTDPKTFQRFKRAGLEELIETQVFQKVSQQTGETELRGANLFQKLRSFGDETLNSWFTQAEKKSVMDFAKLASRVSTKTPRVGLWGMGQTLMGLQALGTAGFGAPAEYAIGATGIIFGAPALYAKLITSDFGRKLLAEGYRLKPGTQEAIRFSSRVATYLNTVGDKEQTPFNTQPATR